MYTTHFKLLDVSTSMYHGTSLLLPRKLELRIWVPIHHRLYDLCRSMKNIKRLIFWGAKGNSYYYCSETVPYCIFDYTFTSHECKRISRMQYHANMSFKGSWTLPRGSSSINLLPDHLVNTTHSFLQRRNNSIKMEDRSWIVACKLSVMRQVVARRNE